MILDQRKGAEMQAGGQRDAVDAGIERRAHADLERLLGRVHGQFFHAVDQHQTAARLPGHGRLDVQARGFGQAAKVELDR
jgi:hypothetical protein